MGEKQGSADVREIMEAYFTEPALFQCQVEMLGHIARTDEFAVHSSLCYNMPDGDRVGIKVDGTKDEGNLCGDCGSNGYKLHGSFYGRRYGICTFLPPGYRTGIDIPKEVKG